MSSSGNHLVIVGAGGHARACIDVVEMQGHFRIAGLVGLPREVGTEILGYKVLGTDADIPRLVAEFTNVLIAVGQIKSPYMRMHLYSQLVRMKCRFPVVISPKSHVSRHTIIGDGTIVMHGAVVNAGVQIGRNCIVNSMALVEHDVVVADHCHISTAAVVNSGVYIGQGTFIGSNSVVKQLVSIGPNSVIGMGEKISANYEPATRVPNRKKIS